LAAIVPAPLLANLKTGLPSALRPSLPIGREFRFGMTSGATSTPTARPEGACRSRHLCRSSKRPGACRSRDRAAISPLAAWLLETDKCSDAAQAS